MDIPPDVRLTDPQARRRQAEVAAKTSRPAETALPGKATGNPVAGSHDAAMVSATGMDQASIGRFVSVLKGMDPANVHRVEELRNRIANGSYRADPDELADLLVFGQPQTPPQDKAE